MEDKGICTACQQAFSYTLIHNGFNDTAYAYCDRCGMTAFFDGWSRSIPSGIDLKVHRPIDAAVAGKAAACSCGGRFQGDASPRCIHCHAELDPVASAEFIERNAPGTKKGRRWQRSWQGLYAIVVEGRSVNDPWTSGGGAA